MSTVEMKWAITQRIDKLSEAALQEVLEHIQSLEKDSTPVNTDIHQNLDRLLRENERLMKRLS